MKALLPSNAAGRQRVMRNAMPIAIFLAISAVALSLPLWSRVQYLHFRFLTPFRMHQRLACSLLEWG